MVKAVYYLTVKFPTPTGVGYMVADQSQARRCQVLSVQLAKQPLITKNPNHVESSAVMATSDSDEEMDDTPPSI